MPALILFREVEGNMSDNKYVLLKGPITIGGAHIGKGEVVELSPLSAQALIDEGMASEAKPDDESKKGIQGAADSGKDGDDLTPSTDLISSTDEGLDGTRKALEKKFKVEDLKIAAKNADVQFAHDAVKADVVNAIITAGKADELLAAE